MKYLLVVGFSCNVYRRNPCARIFLGDKLIDEFDIDQNENSKSIYMKSLIENYPILSPITKAEFKILQKTLFKDFPPLRFYEIEMDRQVQELELKIDIDNADSNYSNGFMTKSTLLRLEICYFFPLHKTLLSRLMNIQRKNIFTKNYAVMRTRKNIIFKLSDNGIKWIEKRTQKLIPMTYGISHYHIGDSGYFLCKLVKKYGLFMAKLYKSNNFNLQAAHPTAINYLINKYEEHAHQRNHD